VNIGRKIRGRAVLKELEGMHAMKCRTVQKLLSMALDGELDETRLRAVMRHVEGCEACRQFRAQLEALAEGYAQLPSMEPRPGFAGRAVARVSGEGRRGGWVGQVAESLSPTPVALSAGSLALGVLLAMTMNGTSVSPEANGGEGQVVAELFDATPLESVGGRYLSLMDETEE